MIASFFSGKKDRDDANIAERTRGVAVRPIGLPGYFPGFPDAEFSLWDYAGQEEASTTCTNVLTTFILLPLHIFSFHIMISILVETVLLFYLIVLSLFFYS